MASSIKLKINSERYTTPNAEDIQDAKEFVLLREETGLLLQGQIDNMLEEAAERIVIICYAYGVDPKRLLFSSSFNEEMMMEIGDVMNELEEEIMDLMLDYSTRVTTDKDRINALLLWLSTLGRGDRNLQETLEGYMYKMMQDWNAAIAAMMYMGVKEKEAVTKIKTYLHDIYQMPEVMTVIRSRRTEFAATYIYYGGVQKGAVGISNNGSTNVTNLAKRTLQMAWMRSQAMDFKEDGASGYYQLRGSTYNCDICDDEVGFHPNIDEILTKPYPHPGCCCYRVPIYGKDVPSSNKKNNQDNIVSQKSFIEERRKEFEKLVNDENYENVEFNSSNGGLKANHTKHNFDKKGGKYEKHIQNAGFKAGHIVILEKEYDGSFYERFTEGTWDGKKFEAAGCETATSNNILRGLSHCASKQETKVAVLDFPNGGFNQDTWERTLGRYKGLEKLETGQYLKFERIICVQNERIIVDMPFV